MQITLILDNLIVGHNIVGQITLILDNRIVGHIA
jgi:hypothetical protein